MPDDLDFSAFPTIAPQQQQPQTQSNALVAGLKTGALSGAAGFENTAAAGAKLVGLTGLSDTISRAASGFQAAAARQSRPDIDKMGWFDSPGSFLTKAGYGIAQAVPALAATTAAVALMPEAAVPAGLSRLGALAPEILGGGEGAGATFAKGLLGGAAYQVPQSIGSQYEAANKQPGGATRMDALRAIVQGVPLGIAQSIGPAGEASAFLNKLGGSIGANIAKGAAANAAAAAIGSGAQDIADNSFDPNMTFGERAMSALHAAASGAVTGGLMGGIFGAVSGGKPIEATTTADLDTATKAIMPTPDLGGQMPPDLATRPVNPSGDQLGGGQTPDLTTRPVNYTGDQLGGQMPASMEARSFFGRNIELPTLTDRPETPSPDQGEMDLRMQFADRHRGFEPNMFDQEPPPALMGDRPEGAMPDVTAQPVQGEDAFALQQRVRQERDVALAKAGITPETAANLDPKIEAQLMAMSGEPQSLTDIARGMTDAQLYGDNVGPATGDQRPSTQGMLDDAAARQRDLERLRVMAPQAFERRSVDALGGRAVPDLPTDHAEATRDALESAYRQPEAARDVPDTSSAQLDDTPTGTIPQAAEPAQPASIAQRVVDTAHELTGGTGGEARIADIRARMPDVAREDVDNALRQIHGDDTDNTLTQAPKGQRNGVDGVSVQGQGKFHNLSVEPREAASAVQERAPEAMGDGERPGAVQEAQRGDAGRDAPTVAERDSGSGEVAQSPREAETQGGQTQIGDRLKGLRDEVEANRGEIGPREAYPGDAEAAKRLGIVLDPEFNKSTASEGAREAYKAVTDRLPLMWRAAQRGEFDAEYASHYRDAQGTFGQFAGLDPQKPLTPKGEAIDTRTPFEKQMAEARQRMMDRRAAMQPEPAPAVVSRVRRVSDQTEAGRQVNSFMRYREQQRQQRALQPPDKVGGTPTDLAQSMREQPQDLQGSGDPQIKPLMREDAVQADPSEAQQHFNAATAGIKPEYKSRIKLIDNPDQLPDAVKQQAAKQGLDLSKVPGLYHEGNVYVHANQMRSQADVEDVIAHEVFGHMGAEAQIGGGGARYDDVMSKAFDSAGGVEGLEKIARQYGMWNTGEAGLKQYVPNGNLSAHQKAMLIDELIAHAAESRRYSASQRAAMAFIGRLKQTLASTFRAAGMENFASRFEKFGMADVERFLENSKALLQGDAPKGTVDLASIPAARMASILREGRDLIMPSIRQQSEERPQEQIERTRSTMAAVGSLAKLQEKIPTDTLLRTLGKGVMSIKTTQDFVRSFGKQFPEFAKDMAANVRAGIITARAVQWKTGAQRQLAALRRADQTTYNRFADMVYNASINRLDQTRPFEDHTWLMDRPADQLAKLRDIHKDISASWNAFGQLGKGGKSLGLQDLYRNQQAGLKADQLFHHINAMHMAVESLLDTKLAGFEKNAVNEIPDRTDIHNDPNAAYAFAKSEVDNRLKSINDYIMRASTDQRVDPEIVSALKATRDRINDSMTRMDQSPYTHLGRSGDFFVKFRFASDEGGAPSEAAVAAVRQWAVENKMGDIQFNSPNNSNVFVRLQSEANMKQFAEALKGDLAQHLDPSDEGVRAGALTKANEWQSKEVAPELKKILDKIGERFGDSDEAQRAKTVAQNELRAAWFDALPEDAAVKLGAQRLNVNGYSGDMLKNHMFRDQVSANALGRMAVAVERSGYSSAILKRMSDAQLGDVGQSVKMSDIGSAFLARNAAQSTRVPSGLFDSLRGFAHSFYLGASPGYLIMQLAQTGTLTMPELARNFGYAKSMGAMTTSLKDVGTVVAAMAKVQHEVYTAWRNGEVTNYQGGVSQRALEIAQQMGLSKEKAEFLQKLDNMGKLEMGTFAHENFAGLETSARSQVPAKILQMLNSTATQSELAARLVAALSAQKLHSDAVASGNIPPGLRKFEDVHDYAGHVVSESMFDWGGDQTSKAFSKSGIFGAVSPLALQFHGFSTRLFSKLTNEAYNAFKGDTPEERTEARRFLLGHLTATTMLAGSLGLPAAGWAAAAITRASTLMPGSGGEAYDVESHFRGFLADIFGKSMGEVIAKGLPRYFNADFSDLGDKDLLPMQELLADRRKLEDSVPDYLAHAWGSSIGAVVNGAVGARDMMNGNVMNGLSRVLPTAMKNLVKAYQLNEHGYTDSQGNKLPGMTAGATDVLRQALGVQGGEYTEYQEKKQAFTGAQEDRQFHAGNIKRNIAISLERGDTEGQAYWMDQAHQYDQDPRHQGMPISPQIPSYLAQRARARAFAQSQGLPIGLPRLDIPDRNLLGSY